MEESKLWTSFNSKTLISENEASRETHGPRPLKFQKVIFTIVNNMLNKKFEIESFDANCCANISLLMSSDESQILQQLLLQQP
jgi:hypothetical protein